MGRIRSGDTSPELAIRRYLHGKGFRFRLHDRSLPGKPDIVLAKYRAAVFVNGCFWHGHSCKDGRRPKSNTVYWDRKLEGNARRGQATGEQLSALGWKQVVVWECEVKKQEVLERLVGVIAS